MSKSKTKALSEPYHQDTRNFFTADNFTEIARLLESKIEPVARTFMNRSGVLIMFEDHGVTDSVEKIKFPGQSVEEGWPDHVSRVVVDSGFNEGGSDYNRIMDAVFEATLTRECLSYLLGLAVGRRLGNVRLDGGAA